MSDNNKRQTDCGTDDSISKKLKKMDGEEESSTRMKEIAERLRQINSNPRKFIFESRTTVDPFSYMENMSHVYQEGDMMFSVLLGLTEDEHAFYKMQILEYNDYSSSVRLYTIKGCGRNMSGLSISKTPLRIESAKEQFNEKYQELTGNIFMQKPFVRYPKKYYEMEIDPK